MNKIFTLLLLLMTFYFTGCKKSDNTSNLTNATITYDVRLSSSVTYTTAFIDEGGYAHYQGSPDIGNGWTEVVFAKKDSFKTAAMEMVIHCTPPIKATSQIFVNGIVKKTLNSSFNNVVDTIYLEDSNVWSN